MALITLQDISFTYDGSYSPVFEHLDLRLDTDWKLALVGRNGRGKTTLLRLMAGEQEYRGTISLPLPCRRHPQPVPDGQMPVAQVLAHLEPEAEQWELLREFSLLELDFGLLERPFSSLSGGEQTRVTLAALFARDHVYPMLDEPTNHLDAQGRAAVARYLKKKDTGFILVSHDSAFLDDCVDHVLALNPTGPELVQSTFSVWFENKQQRDHQELLRNQQLRQEIGHLTAAARRASDWSDKTEAGKYATKNSGLRPDRGYVGHKAAKLMKRAKNIEARREQAITETASLLKDIEQADPLKLTPLKHHAQRLIELRDISISYGTHDICKDISFSVNQGDRLCLSGRNGSGKSSLLRLLLGEDVPHTGSLFRVSGLTISYVPQTMNHLAGPLREHPKRNQIDATQFMTLLRKLDFPRALFEGLLEDLSPGQKKKVLLATSLCQSAHLYLMDEPLNYVDLFSRRQLEEVLLEFRPTLVFVEHDRSFAQRIATAVIRL